MHILTAAMELYTSRNGTKSHCQGRHRCPQGEDFPPGLGYCCSPAENSQALDATLKIQCRKRGGIVLALVWAAADHIPPPKSNKSEPAPSWKQSLGNYSLQIFHSIRESMGKALQGWEKGSFPSSGDPRWDETHQEQL